MYKTYGLLLGISYPQPGFAAAPRFPRLQGQYGMDGVTEASHGEILIYRTIAR